MKKILIITLIATSLLTACGKDKKTENSSTDANSPQNAVTQSADSAPSDTNETTEPVTADYTLDFAAACAPEAIEETYEYFISMQPSADPDSSRAEISQTANYVSAANNLGLDRTEALKEVILAMGGDAAIDEVRSNGIPESYINLILAYQASSVAITDYMKANNLLADGREEFMNTYWRAKHVLVSTEGKTDAEKAEAKAKAEEILARAEAGENFDALVSEYSEDPGSKTNPDGYVFTTGTMVQEFEDGTKNTEIGKFTLVETSYGYHVIQRLALDETPELYEKFYAESGIESTINEEIILDFVNQHA